MKYNKPIKPFAMECEYCGDYFISYDDHLNDVHNINVNSSPKNTIDESGEIIDGNSYTKFIPR